MKDRLFFFFLHSGKLNFLIKETEKLLSRCHCTLKVLCGSVHMRPPKETSENRTSDRHIACKSLSDTNEVSSDRGGSRAERVGTMRG